MNKKYWAIGAIAAIIIIIGAVGAYNQATEEVVDLPERVDGNPNASTVLMEFSDLQCPACRTYSPFVAQLGQDFREDIKIVYKHFPLNIHPNAKVAAYATEAAGNQGKFWQMLDKIFEGQNTWSRQSRSQAENTFEEYARELGLDMEQFKKDADSKSVKNKVDEDYEEGIKLGVDSTPSFFLNGTKISNPRSYPEFKELIQKAVDGRINTDN